MQITRVIANKTQEEWKRSEHQNKYTALGGREVYKDSYRDRTKRYKIPARIMMILTLHIPIPLKISTNLSYKYVCQVSRNFEQGQ
jgi:hypothetical protein